MHTGLCTLGSHKLRTIPFQLDQDIYAMFVVAKYLDTATIK